ncbi:MAG TPA: hypothetical protein VKW77_08330, partial [Acidimicrobiales bacterium]|nr:hypothetical protein [Acidimicrobiales bacterium]
GAVSFARTFNFSTMSVATGPATVTADFTLPALPDGTYQLEVVTNAVASSATSVQIQAGALSTGGPPGVPPSGGTGSAGSSGGGGGGGGGGGCGATGLEGVVLGALLGGLRALRRRARA